jgi:hypothetical protein
VAEAFLYVYVGLSSFSYSAKANSGEEVAWSMAFFGVEILIVFAARFAGVFVLSWITML